LKERHRRDHLKQELDALRRTLPALASDTRRRGKGKSASMKEVLDAAAGHCLELKGASRRNEQEIKKLREKLDKLETILVRAVKGK
jgi:hypothetical protein